MAEAYALSNAVEHGLRTRATIVDMRGQLNIRQREESLFAHLVSPSTKQVDNKRLAVVLVHISHFSSTACSDTMAKRSQQDSGEERVTAKSRPMMNLTARMPSFVSSSTSVSPGKRYYGSQDPWRSIEGEDRSGRLDNVNSQEVARPQNSIMGNDETELELSVESRSFVNE